MIIKNITKKPISITAAILPFKKGNVVPIKINKFRGFGAPGNRTPLINLILCFVLNNN